jgi:cytochrome c
MKALFTTAVLALGAMSVNLAHASPELAKAKNCMACHAIGSKLVGPSFKDIAAKYAGNKDAEANLAGKIRKGSTGVWGAIPMPANANVNEAEAATLSKWVLSQK